MNKLFNTCKQLIRALESIYHDGTVEGCEICAVVKTAKVAIKQTQTQTGETTVLSRKYYRAIAEIVKRQIEDEIEDAAILIAYDLADYFTQNNPRFDRERFLEDCGL